MELNSFNKLIEKNFKLIPIKAREKKPAIKDWQTEATNEIAKIKKWLSQFPDMNVGIVTGKASNIFIVDIDQKNGGLETLEQLKKEGFSFDTLCVKTGGGGYHFYYKCPGNKEIKNKTGILKGIDIRGQGGFIVAPPSIHKSGNKYEFINNSPIIEMPNDLFKRILNNNKENTPFPTSNSLKIFEGERNNILFKRASLFHTTGIDKITAMQIIKKQNYDLCFPPLEETEIERIIQSAYSYPINIPYTDMGNALRLERKYGYDIRYCKSQNTWYIYKDTHWCIDDCNEIIELAKKTVLDIPTENNQIEMSKELKQHFKNSQSEIRLKAMINLASSMPKIIVRPQDFDNDYNLINCQNGVVNLKTGEITSHDRKLMLSKIINIKYIPDAKSELWNTFLQQITNQNQELLNLLQIIAGYCLTGINSEQAFFIIYGPGKNGKTVFVESIKKVFGSYGLTTSSTTFTVSKSERIRNDLAALENIRLVVTSESNENDFLDEAIIKQITGGEAITARKLYKEPVSFIPQCKCIFISNYLPNIRAGGYALKRRLKLVHFSNIIPNEIVDKNLLRKLSSKENQEAILAWAIAGAIEWYKKGLPENIEMEKQLTDYFSSNDNVRDFLENNYVIDETAKTPCSIVYTKYCKWCKSIAIRPLNKNSFGKRIYELGVKSSRTSQKRFYCLRNLPYEGDEVFEGNYNSENDLI